MIVGVVLIKDEQILLVQDKEGTWNLPGGKVEQDEDEIQALRREVEREELPDIRIKNIRLFQELEGTTPHSGRPITLKVYLADHEGGSEPGAEI